MNPQQIAVLVVAGALGLLVLLLLVYGRPRLSDQEPPPANFSRGDPDGVLEGARLRKMQTWGMASAVFIAGFLAIYMVYEPFRQPAKARAMLNTSVERGKHHFGPDGEANCASCHGPQGQGGFAATNTTWPAPPLDNVLQRYSLSQVKQIVKQGRPGTPMPTWGLEFGGPLNDQKIDDILNYLQTFQLPAEKSFELAEDMTDGAQVFAQKCAVCHGRDARGQAMGRPLPTFYAPDLTTEFYRLGLDVLKQTQKDFDARRTTQQAILTAGEQAARNTIDNGRANTPMPPWKARIGPKQVDAVVAYLKSIQRQPS